MPTPVGATPPVLSTAPTPTTAVDRPEQLGKDTFLKLLVAQLKYQDPGNPTSNSEFMAQTAQFSQVEKLDQLIAQNASMVASSQALSAGVMVGQHVTYATETGEPASGTVSSVRFDPTGTTFVIDGVDVPMGRITEISMAAALSGGAAVSSTTN